MIQPNDVTTYPNSVLAIENMQAHGWTVHVLPSECGRYAWDVIATHPTCGASPMSLTANVQRSPHLYWWADFVTFESPSETWRTGTGGTMRGRPLRNELKRRHPHRARLNR